REEHARAGFRREVAIEIAPSHRDPSPDPLQALIQSERQGILSGCLPRLDREYREVVQMRMNGLAYSDIAARLNVNPNQVATWFSRAIRLLAQCVRKRIGAIKRSPHA